MKILLSEFSIIKMVKLQFENNQQFKITLPKSIVLAKGWKKGDNIEIQIDSNGNIVLKK